MYKEDGNFRKFVSAKVQKGKTSWLNHWFAICYLYPWLGQARGIDKGTAKDFFSHFSGQRESNSEFTVGRLFVSILKKWENHRHIASPSLQTLEKNTFFSCESSSRSANVRQSVCLSVCLSVCPSVNISFKCLKTHVMRVRYASVIHHWKHQHKGYWSKHI